VARGELIDRLNRARIACAQLSTVEDLSDHVLLRNLEIRFGEESLSVAYLPAGRVRALCFHPDGKTLAVATETDVRIWDYRGDRIVGYANHSEVDRIAYSANARALLTAAKRSARTYSFELATTDLSNIVTGLRKRVGRELTSEERQQYLRPSPSV